VILDVDGTLVDSNDAHARAWLDAFGESGVTVPFDRVRRAIGMGGDKLLLEVAGIPEDSERGTRISHRRAELFETRYLAGIRPFPRVRALIERFLADGFTLAVASSAKAHELHPLLERAGVADLVRLRTSSDDAEESKPDPDIVQAAIAQAHADRARTLMLGDTPYDLAAAHAAGIRIVALECGGWSRVELSSAEAVYRDPADLLEGYDQSPFASLKDTVNAGA
jgi:HAD superfamily hydrolase (TIGR01509 family)